MSNHIVTTTEAYDFLALVPQLVGFTPENSVVLVAFRGNRTCGALRFNLPDTNTPAQVQKRIASSLIGTVCKIPGVDALVPVIYTAAAIGATGGLPYEQFADTLAQRAELSGFLVRDALCVASDAWGSYLDVRCPAVGNPLGQIATSTVHDNIPAHLRHGLGTVLSGTELPVVDPATKERVGAQYRRLQRGFGGPGARSALVSRIGEVVDPVEMAEVAIGWEPTTLTPAHAAALLHLVQGPGSRDQVMVQFAFGREVGVEAHAANLRYWDLQRRTGLAMDDIVARDLALEAGRAMKVPQGGVNSDRGRGDDADSRARRRGLLMGDVMLGNTQDRPDPERCERAIDLLKTIVAMAPRASRSAPLCMLAWLSWAMGRGTVAGIFIDTVLAIDPEYSMARLLEALLGSGHLPEWAFQVPVDDAAEC